MSLAEALSGPDRAAVMVMVLDDERASELLARLDPAEIQLIGERMVALGEISPETIAAAIAGFVEHSSSRGIPDRGRLGKVDALLTRAVGPLRAQNLMKRITPPDAPRPTALELARWLNPEVLLPLIRDEPAQAIALLLVQIDPAVAAQVLHSLPEAQQTTIVHRIATLGPVAPGALAMLETVLDQRIAESHGSDLLAMGGVREAAAILNAAARTVEKRVMPELTRLDKVIARAVEGEMFKFEHLYVLDDKSMGALLRETDSDTLIIALKGIEEGTREVFFRAMSSRAADGLRDEIAARGRTRMAEVLEAQKAVVGIARRLAAEGTIVFGSGGEDDYV